MGFLRKTLHIGSGRSEPRRPHSAKERAAKTAEQQVRIQQKMLAEQQRSNADTALGLSAPAAPESYPVRPTADVRLISVGDKKIQVIKIVRAATGLGLKEAKALVDHAPSDVRQGIESADAQQLKTAIEKAGGTAELIVHEPDGVPPTGDETSAGSVAADLERLAALRDRGMLTDDEFAAAKTRVITGP